MSVHSSEVWQTYGTYLVEKVVVPTTDTKGLVEHNMKAVAAKQILLDSVQNHLIPHIARKNTAKEMYVALGTLYQSVKTSKKMFLRTKSAQLA